jgi:hypothetical protein
VAEKFPLQVVVSADDRASGVLRRVGRTAREQLREMRASSTSASAALRSMGSGLATVAKLGAGASLAVGGLALKAAHDFVEAGSELDDFRQKTGLGVEAIQSWRYAMGLAGVSTETFNGALLAFGRSLGQARMGTGKLGKGLQKLGAQDLLAALKGTQDTEEALRLYIAAMEQIPDPSRRAALAALAFGGAGSEMALAASAGSEELARLRREKMADGVMSTEQAAKAAELGDRLDRLKSQYSAIATTVGGEVATALEPHLVALGEWVTANREVIGQNVAGAVDALAGAFRSIDWGTIGDGIGIVVDGLRGLRDIALDAKEALDLFPTSVNDMPWADKGADVLQWIDEAAPGPSIAPRGPGPQLTEQFIRGLGATGALTPQQMQDAARGWMGFSLTTGQGPGRILGEGAVKERALSGPGLAERLAASPNFGAKAAPAKLEGNVVVEIKTQPGTTATVTRDTTPAAVQVQTGRRSAGTAP